MSYVMKDKVVTVCEVRFNFWERLKLLFGGRIQFQIAVKTENVVGRTDTKFDVQWIGFKPKAKRPKVVTCDKEIRLGFKAPSEMAGQSRRR
jgi:hypothetical protein